MAVRLLKLRYPATCSSCAASLVPGDRGWWDPDLRAATCTACRRPEQLQRPTDGTSSTPTLTAALPTFPAMSAAGGSARQEYLRRRTKRESQIDEKWGALSGVVKFLSDEPQSTKAWAKGSQGEQRLAAHLVKALGDKVVMLHDRRIPGTRANIDHLVVAASGVWIVDAKSYRGKVEQRDVGGWLRTDNRLMVGGRDRSTLTGGLFKQTLAVLTALDGVEVDVEVMAALCFVDSEWAVFAKPFLQGGVLVTWPQMLCKSISEAGSLSRDQIMRVAERLAEQLPAAVAN